MIYLAGGLTDRLRDTGSLKQEPRNMGKRMTLRCTLSAISDLKQRGCRREKPWWYMLQRDGIEAFTLGNQFLSSEQFPDVPSPGLLGGSGALSEPNDIITSRKGCCHRHQL